MKTTIKHGPGHGRRRQRLAVLPVILALIGMVAIQGATSAAALTSAAANGDITTVAGNVNNAASSGDGGPATSAGISAPSAVAVDSAGNLYIADANAFRVRKVTVATGIITTVAGNGTFGSSGDGGQATSAQLGTPQSVALDQAGNLYIADTGNGDVRKVTPAGIISTVAGNGMFADSGDGGPATAAALGLPYGVVVDQAGNLYIADNFNNNVRKVTAATGIITTVAGDPTGMSAGFSGDGNAATAALLSSPQAVALDAAGNLYIDDSGNQRIREVTASSGIITTVAGNGSFGFSGDGGLATSAALGNPGGVAVDAAGNLFIADSGNQRVREVTASSGIITTVAGNGTTGFSGDGGPATAAGLNSPQGVALDTAGNLYIADQGNHVVREVVGVVAPGTPAAAYHPLSPMRVTDTRSGSGYPNSGTPVGPSGSVTVTMPASVPTTATAVSLSVTEVDGTSDGFLSVYPTGKPPLTPTAVLNYVAGPPECRTPDCVVPNLVVSKVNGGKVTVVNGSTTGSVDVVVDLEGYFDPTAATTSGAGHYTPLNASRVADTRCVATPQPAFCAGENLPPSNTTSTLSTGQTFNVPVTGASKPSQGISAAVVELAVTNTTVGGYLTAYPTGTPRPTAANVNFVAGQTTATRAIVPVDANGDFTIYNYAGNTDVVVDVVGLFSDATGPPSDGSLYTPIVPARLTDTRTDVGPLGPNGSITFPVAGQANIPAEVNGSPTAAALNVAEASATSPGYLTVTPNPLTPPAFTADVNFNAGEIRANADLAQLNSTNGTVSIYNYAGTTQVAVDAFGYFSAARSAASGSKPGFVRTSPSSANGGALTVRH
ncbi:MAG: NHL repeat-containing protein [Actinomycetota bacterium]|nr:NHL repeat-containing protein [Actinomycetota bacterium]